MVCKWGTVLLELADATAALREIHELVPSVLGVGPASDDLLAQIESIAGG